MSPAFHAEEARAVWIPPGIGAFVQDLRYGARQLRHNRLFTFVALTGLALAIGLNTAVFSVVEAVYWRPLPVKDGDRVIRLARVGRDDRIGGLFSETELRHYRESGALEAVTGVAVDDRLGADWPDAAAPRAIAALVTPDFFEMLGGHVVAGRLLQRDDAETAVLITETAWRRRLLARPDVVGAKLTLNGFPFSIAGVLADKSVAIVGSPVDIVLPLRSAELLRLPDTAGRLSLIGKLRIDAELEQTQAALDVVAQRWFAAHPEDTRVYRPLAFLARLAGARSWSSIQGPEMLLLVAVLLVLLIACANLTNLLLARAEARRREMAVRLSLGAARFRLIRQLLTECFLLTVMGGALGLASANWALRLAQAAMPRYLPADAMVPWLDLSINSTVFLYTLATCALTAFLFGLAPAMEATRVGVATAMKADSRTRGSAAGARLRDLLIAFQMGACVILLVTTLRLDSAMSVLDDFLSSLDTKPVVSVQLLPQVYGYSAAASSEFLLRARERIAGLASVEAAGITQAPFMRTLGGGAGAELEIEGRNGKQPAPGMGGVISDGCLRVFGLRLASGRDFTAAESKAGTPVVLINEPMSRALWPRSTALGQRIRVWSRGKPEPWQEVIGVVAEKPIAESGSGGHSVLRPLGAASGRLLQVRTRGDRGAAMLAMQAMIRELDPRIAANVNSMQAFVDFTRWGPRLVSAGSFVVAMASLWMAAIGLYGVTAYAAMRRTKEIGIRMALGARQGDVLWMIVRQGSILIAAGLTVGSLLAAIAERVLSSSLRLLPRSSVETYAAVAAFLAGVALLAMLVPSLRATRVNPVAALREDG